MHQIGPGATELSSTVNAIQRIDAHHHLWRYSDEEYGWIGDDMQALRRNFLLDDLRSELAAAGVSGTVAVQARQTVAETDWLLHLAEEAGSPIQGVVGWLPLDSESLPDLLEPYRDSSKLKGLRHVVQAEPNGFLDRENFLRGMRTMQGSGLVYDILIYERQLAEAIRFVDRFPQQRFVLDHIAKPDVRSSAMEPWRSALHRLAERPNVACKLSGMVTEADPQHWTEPQLRPYAEVVLEAFGAHRVMAGTDWPVLTVACGYAQWWQILEGWTAALSRDEQAAILGDTARHWYGLKPE